MSNKQWLFENSLFILLNLFFAKTFCCSSCWLPYILSSYNFIHNLWCVRYLQCLVSVSLFLSYVKELARCLNFYTCLILKICKNHMKNNWPKTHCQTVLAGNLLWKIRWPQEVSSFSFTKSKLLCCWFNRRGNGNELGMIMVEEKMCLIKERLKTSTQIKSNNGSIVSNFCTYSFCIRSVKIRDKCQSWSAWNRNKSLLHKRNVFFVRVVKRERICGALKVMNMSHCVEPIMSWEIFSQTDIDE